MWEFSSWFKIDLPIILLDDQPHRLYSFEQLNDTSKEDKAMISMRREIISRLLSLVYSVLIDRDNRSVVQPYG